MDPLNLLAAVMESDAAADAEKKFVAALRNEHFDLTRFFKREKINILLPGGKWIGRVTVGGISYQALFSMDSMRVRFESKSERRKQFRFSIFNPPGSKLLYRISLEKNKKKKVIFSEYFGQKRFYSKEIPVDGSWQKCKIVLETQGKGIGAWLNPQFIMPKEKPRIFVVIVLDSVRADHTSLYGYPRRTTPALERLARDSRVFRQAFSSSSWTLPAHVSLFSGMELLDHQVLTPNDHIKEDHPLLAEVFQKSGFSTAAFTGNGFVSDRYGFHRGFQVYSNNPGRVLFPDSAARVLKEFKDFAEIRWGEDLFVFLHTYQAHLPYNFPMEFKNVFNPQLQRNSLGLAHFMKNWKAESFGPLPENSRQELVDMYDTAIYYVDQTLISGVVQYLEEKGVYEQAGIVVASDHGEEFYDHGSWEHGHNLYDESIRIPLLIKFPGNRRQGIDGTLTSISDIPALLLENSGLKLDAKLFPDAHGRKNRVLSIALPVSPLIRQIPPKVSFLSEHFHFIHNIIDRKALAFFAPQPQNLAVYELYERKDDKEATNLADRMPMVAKKFQVLLADYLQGLRRAHGNKRKLDADLRRELKSLGYLDN